jgi:hypothetical protein
MVAIQQKPRLVTFQFIESVPQVISEREFGVVVKNISGKVTVSGKMDCLGCSNVSRGAATDADRQMTKSLF